MLKIKIYIFFLFIKKNIIYFYVIIYCFFVHTHYYIYHVYICDCYLCQCKIDNLCARYIKSYIENSIRFLFWC